MFLLQTLTKILTPCNCYTMQEWADHGVEQVWVPTLDFQPPSLLDIERGLKVIQDYKLKRESAYVHCKAGKGRSATVTACYLIKVTSFFLSCD